ncbi:DMT family transporter [uncultured Rikenella sp.]|uniref:EamA family transporter n=2 Tax=uncultured Rikenella sp. TaxID=368003 RepID=UPI00262C1F3D|nr:DMT family transporter [uncultured Rikenella sp.]
MGGIRQRPVALVAGFIRIFAGAMKKTVATPRQEAARKTRGIAYALISSATFGLIPLFTVPILSAGTMSGPSILFYRFGLATILIGLIGAMRGKSFRINFRQGTKLVVLGWFYAATSMWLLESYSMIPSGVATTIHFLYPVLVTLIMVTFYHEPKSIWIFGASAVSIAGVALLNWTGGAVSYEGIATALLTVVTYSIYIVGVNKSGIGRMDPIPLTFYILLAGALMFATHAEMTTGIELVRDGRTAFNLLVLALVSTVISDLTLVMAVERVGSTIVSVLGSLEPLVAVLVGVFWFSEPFGWKGALGLSLIIGSVVVVILQTEKRRK